MQQLRFETSWDKALSAQDRNQIEKLFIETKHQSYSTIVFSPIREAINHQNELLITVLVHNFTQNPLTFENTQLVYSNEQAIIAANEFTLPALKIPPQTSMPWTFIFPQNSYTSGISPYKGRLEIRSYGDNMNLTCIKGYSLVSIYAQQLNCHQQNDEWTFITTNPLMKFQNGETNEYCYWELDWYEDEEGSDHLLIAEQSTPSIEYIEEPSFSQQHMIIASSFSFQDNVIKEVIGYGYQDESLTILNTVMFKFEKSVLVIKTGAVITGSYTSLSKPISGDILFTM